ncbi:Atxe2 family lasso peptide isopeptidase [Asticcacaulis sp. DW145]|uniref:Atxe2 family lasso peptide isopeptidase n=1 Tax=Asticcacaulis sp. DW145 TaxID=3095608 RepID=UPI00308D6BE5|nr:Atxe2 family lasso peptide isopeptidase [Asticcacaulis sp. DW145]
MSQNLSHCNVRAGISALTIGSALVWSGAAFADVCDSLLPTGSGSVPAVARGIVADDLLRLRDFGPPGHPNIPDKLFTVSPEQDRIALQLRRADPSQNAHCFAIVVQPLDPNGSPVVIDKGGEYLTLPSSGRGLAAVPSGVLVSDPPKWSPDGQWLAYLRKENGTIRLWRVRSDGSRAGPAAELPFDPESFDWGEAGQTLVVVGRPTLKQAQADLMVAGREGHILDDALVPGEGSLPQLKEPIAREVFVIELQTKTVRPASAEERARLRPPDLPSWTGATRLTRVRSDQAASVVALRPEELTSPTELQVTRAGRVSDVCGDPLCSGIADLWWRDENRLVFLSRRPGDSRTRLLEWTRHQSRPRQILETEDVLFGCQLVSDRLICGHEASKQPRRLISIDLQSGEKTPLFDPNPDFQTIALGSVQRLRWTNDRGIATYSDLVLPRNHRPGDRHPLVIVQYITRGFLRGGTGDEYPIWLLAEQGFAVLSFQRPQDVGWVAGVKSPDEANRAGFQDWADRRSVQSSLETGLQRVINMGVVHPDRIGITGLSDGASTAQFALIHGPRFAAAILSSCCEDITGMITLNSPSNAQWFRKMGYPAAGDRAEAFWKPAALLYNVDQVKTPILLQMPDREYLGALTAYSALKDAGTPIELVVYPDEFHVKIQPAHRAAIYRRNVDWLRFWLMGLEDDTPSKADQYRRWRALTAAASAAKTSASPGQ